MPRAPTLYRVRAFPWLRKHKITTRWWTAMRNMESSLREKLMNVGLLKSSYNHASDSRADIIHLQIRGVVDDPFGMSHLLLLG